MNTPYMIDWAITNKCNLDCLHCRGMAEEELDKETILNVAREIPSLNPGWVIIEGGEPLLCKELLEILEIIHKGNITIYLITNGMLLNEELARKFAALNVKLMISIDGADKDSYETIRRKASFEKLKRSIAIANSYEILDSCPVTIGKYNYHQIDKLFKFVKEIGYNKITFLGVKPCKDYSQYVLNRKEYEEFFYSIIKNQEENKMEVYVDEPFFKPFITEHHLDGFANSTNGIIVPEISRCIFGEYMFIETNGDIKPCTFAPISIGNVNEKSLNKIWEDMQNSKIINKIKDFSQREDLCGKCEYLNDCGGCRSRAINLTGNWEAFDPSCPLMEVGI